MSCCEVLFVSARVDELGTLIQEGKSYTSNVAACIQQCLGHLKAYAYQQPGQKFFV